MGDIGGLINSSSIGKEIVSGLSPVILETFSPLINILKVVGIALFVYILFLIIKAFFSLLVNRRIRKIAKNVEEINQKLDVLIGKNKTKPEKKLKKDKK